MTEAKWDKVMAMNTKGVFLYCQEAITRMPKRSGATSVGTLCRRLSDRRPP
jgi:NAD(P)-dependent dehydrogenase (short-subunit alcohol dehydrogenase family)